jgi:hypothetical protein
MLYRKNIYLWEQWSRVAGGAALAVWGLAFSADPMIGYIAAASGAALAVTGVFGWCPACAMVGRRTRD